MKNKKLHSLILILLVTITIGFGQWNNNKVTAATDPTKPVLVSLTADGNEENTIINFNEGTEIVVKYSVGRYAGVDGVNIYGSGSGLNITPTGGSALNFSYNLKELTYYEGTFTLTNLTQFRGYAWVNNLSNGTFEDLAVFNHLDAWHYLYVNEDGTPPEFSDIDNVATTGANGIYRASANDTTKPIVVSYRVYGGSPTDIVTLVTSVYRDIITNASVNVFDGSLSVIQMNFSAESETYVEFNATIDFSVRTLYFCANNSYGWDSWGSQNQLHSNLLGIRAIYNGYDFYSQITLGDTLTDVDNIRFNITTFNTTESETFGINYYVQESSYNDTRIIPWTEIEGILNQTYSEENVFGYNDTVREYLVSIGSLSAGNVLCYEAYNIYYGELYNETLGLMHKVIIQDSKPTLSLYPINKSYLNRNNITFWYTAEIARGEIVEATLDFDDGSPIETLGDGADNITYHVYPETTVEYNATLNVTVNIIRETQAPILVNNSVSVLIYLDFNPPTLTIFKHTNNNTDITDGYVELYLDYTDDYTGIFRVWVFWDDGTVQNATGDTFVYHNYMESGTYVITVMAEDKAGNQINVTITYTVVLPEKTTITPTPYAIISAIFSVMLIGYVVRNKKIKRNS